MTKKLHTQQTDVQASLEESQVQLRQSKTTQEDALQLLTDDLENFKAEHREVVRKLLKRIPTLPTADVPKTDKPKYGSNRVRAHFESICGFKSPIKGPAALDHVHRLQSGLVEGTGNWLFDTPEWKAWVGGKSSSLLSVQGPPGVGKSSVAVHAYNQLKELYPRSSNPETCIVYHAAVADSTAPLSFVNSLIDITVQLADQNDLIRQRLEEKLDNEDSFQQSANADIDGWIQFYLCDIFSKTSKLQLVIVYDDYDEMEIDAFRTGPLKVMQKIEEEGLRIKLLTTSRGAPPLGPVINMGKDQILSDLRLIVSDRLKSEDSAYHALKLLPQPTKRKIAKKIEEHACGLLYVDQMLRHLASLVKEDLINEVLESMPKTTPELFSIMFERIEERFSHAVVRKFRFILVWMTFTWMPLTVKDVHTIIKSTHSDQLEELLHALASFFEIRIRLQVEDPDADTLFAPSPIEPPLKKNEQTPFYELKYRALKAAFNDKNRSFLLRLTQSEVHRQLFRRYVQIIKGVEYFGTSLHSLAHLRMLFHWSSIDPNDLSAEDRTSTYQAFYDIIQDRQYLLLIEGHYVNAREKRAPLILYTLGLAGLGFVDAWRRYAAQASNAKLPEVELEYWQDENNILKPIWEAAVRAWLQSKYYQPIEPLFGLAKLLTTYVPAASALENLDKDGSEYILKMADSAGIDLDCDAHHAIACAMFKSDLPRAIEELEKAIQSCDRPYRRAAYYLQLAHFMLGTRQWEKTIEYVDLAVEEDKPRILSEPPPPGGERIESTREVYIQACAETSGTDTDVDLPEEALRRRYCQALQAKAIAQLGQQNAEEGVKTLADSRKTNADTVTANCLLTELMVIHHLESSNDCIQRVVEFAPYHQLMVLTDPELRKDGARLLALQVVNAGRFDDVEKIFETVLQKLDEVDAGPPIKVQLARLMLEVKRPVEDVKELLYSVLDLTGSLKYTYTQELPVVTSRQALYLMSTILLEEFRASTTGQKKTELLKELKGLSALSLPSTTTMTSSDWIPWRISIATMLAKVGSKPEYEKVMRQIFSSIMENLTDSHECNNMTNLFNLAQLLSMTPELPHHAKIVNSAIFSAVETGSSEWSCRQEPKKAQDANGYDVNTTVDAFCDGACFQVTKFKSWDTKMFRCLSCPDVWLCEVCYEKRLEMNKDGHDKTGDLNFCCSDGRYLAPPDENWLGVKDGVLHFNTKTEDDIILTNKIGFRDFLDEIKTEWEKGWEKYWSGI